MEGKTLDIILEGEYAADFYLSDRFDSVSKYAVSNPKLSLEDYSKVGGFLLKYQKTMDRLDKNDERVESYSSLLESLENNHSGLSKLRETKQNMDADLSKILDGEKEYHLLKDRFSALIDYVHTHSDSIDNNTLTYLLSYSQMHLDKLDASSEKNKEKIGAIKKLKDTATQLSEKEYFDLEKPLKEVFNALSRRKETGFNFDGAFKIIDKGLIPTEEYDFSFLNFKPRPKTEEEDIKAAFARLGLGTKDNEKPEETYPLDIDLSKIPDYNREQNVSFQQETMAQVNGSKPKEGFLKKAKRFVKEQAKEARLAFNPLFELRHYFISDKPFKSRPQKTEFGDPSELSKYHPSNILN